MKKNTTGLTLGIALPVRAMPYKYATEYRMAERKKVLHHNNKKIQERAREPMIYHGNDTFIEKLVSLLQFLRSKNCLLRVTPAEDGGWRFAS
jgi:hypothetical protein